jgi:hypothetical protein
MSSLHPFEERQPLQNYFRTLLHTVVGQAFHAAGYELLEEPMKWSGGRFRYVRQLDSDWSAYIEFQVLVYGDSAWVGKQPSRFTVNLYRSNQPGGRPVAHPRYQQRLLSQLVVVDFATPILPDADYWWSFQDTESLGKGLAEAGYLIVGYGIPWLAGDLVAGVDR